MSARNFPDFCPPYWIFRLANGGFRVIRAKVFGKQGSIEAIDRTASFSLVIPAVSGLRWDRERTLRGYKFPYKKQNPIERRLLRQQTTQSYFLRPMYPS